MAVWTALRSSACALLIGVSLGATAQTAAQTASPVPAGAASRELAALFEQNWEWRMTNFPQFSTFLGETRYNDRLADNSPAAIRRRQQQAVDDLKRAQAIDPAQLTPDERVSRAAFIRELSGRIEIARFYGDLPIQGPAPVTLGGGPQVFWPALVRATRFATVADYDAYVKRLAAMPRAIDELKAEMTAGVAAGWSPPRESVVKVPAQIAAQVVADPTASAFFAPFAKFPPGIDSAEQQRLREAGRRIIAEQVIPAFEGLRRFYETEYLPRTRTSVSAAAQPGGIAYYDALLREQTSTDLTSQQIHDRGIAEVARIEAEMDAVMRGTGFKGTRAEFLAYLRGDPKFYWTTPDEMLAALRDIAKRADAQLPPLFRELPRLPYGIRSMPRERGAAAEHYTRGAADGSRAAWFEANTNDMRRRPKWQMPAIVLHETVPGHHTQTARAQELQALPRFRREAFLPGYGEGWALYAERLGLEMGMYEDPYDRYGYLSAELLRATRMVVDTGLHAKGWSRAQAIDYMRQHTTEADSFIESEVDRYIVQAGQATTYKVGQMKILELRQRAQAALGSKFDVRAFHNVILDSGALPLSVVEENVDRWIASQKAS